MKKHPFTREERMQIFCAALQGLLASRDTYRDWPDYAARDAEIIARAAMRKAEYLLAGENIEENN